MVPGGVLLILDFFNPDGPEKETLDDWPEDARKTSAKAGFTEEEMRTEYEQAGLGDFGFKILAEPVVMYHGGIEKRRIAFLAKGTKR